MSKLGSGKPHLDAFRTQKNNAAKRGIPFLFTHEQWVEWWGDDILKRGRCMGDLVMSRRGDAGPYSPENVYKNTQAGNLAEAIMTDEHRRASSDRLVARNADRAAAGIPHHLSVRGDGYPKSKSVITPDGRFGSIALAADHYGITRAAMHQRINNWKWKAAGFYYE